MPATFKSSRSDKRGHWTAGKKRNEPKVTGYRSLSAFFTRLWETVRKTRGAQDLASWLGVSESTVHRWKAGKMVPSQHYVDGMVRWLRAVRG